MTHGFCVKKALNKEGWVICNESFRTLVANMALELSTHLCRDLGKENYTPGQLTEVQEPEISANGMTRLLFRVGIVYCEIKAFFDKTLMMFTNTKFGIIQ
ncbi:MAG: hypothetical protein KBC78_00645 [Candidatus Pacebacteria bacterium]|nr:hypothetical protein [Candidatus Paceibacterota bacterium]